MCNLTKFHKDKDKNCVVAGKCNVKGIVKGIVKYASFLIPFTIEMLILENWV
jgi:hypothetical protein